MSDDDDERWMYETLVPVSMTPNDWAAVTACVLATGHPARYRLAEWIAEAVSVSS